MCASYSGRQRTIIRPTTNTQRAGLSALEFTACVVAVIGGAWIGALYLGIDLRHMAFVALNEAQLLDKVPSQWRPEDPRKNVMTREQLVATLREELGSLRNQIAVLRTGSAEVASGEAVDGTPATITPLPTKQQTLAYWSRLNEIALGEGDLQREAEAAFSAPNAAKVFAIKGRICRFAAKAVEAVPTQGVDEEALRFGRQLGLWYTRGEELYGRAVRIWETPIGADARKQLNAEWKQADEQHRNEARLVHEKAAAVRGTVSRIYEVEFPDFGKSPTTAAHNETPANST